MAFDPFGEDGSPTSQASDYEPAGGGPPTPHEDEAPPAPAEQPKGEVPGFFGAPTDKAAEHGTPEFFDRVEQPAAPEEPAKPKKKGFFERANEIMSAPLDDNAVGRYLNQTIDDPATTGAQKARQIGAVLAGSVRSREATAESIANAQKAMPPQPEFLKAADEQLAKSHGFFGALDAYLSNPRAAFAKGVQGLVQGGGVLAASGAAGAAGGLPGVIAGAAGAGYLDAYGSTILSTLSEHGVDLADKDAVLQGLNDPALMSQANAAAAQAGIPAAIINAFSFGLAGRVFSPVARAVARPVLGKVAGVGAEAATQGAIGAGGEAATQEYSQGKITNPGAVVEAGASQVALGGAFAGAHAVGAHAADPLQDVADRTMHSESIKEAPPANAQERAQQAIKTTISAEGGDLLDQVVGMTQVNAEVGGVYDAAAVHGARMETQRLQAEQADADAQGDIDQGQREQALNQAEVAKAPDVVDKDQGFAQREAEQAAQQDQDFTAAKNQVGQQAVESAQTAEAGAEKGGANEPRPTLADALPPDQLAALQGLKARRAAEAAKPALPAELSVQDRMRALAKGTDDDFEELPPDVPSKAPTEPERALQGTEKAQEPAEEEESPTEGPPPVTAQTLAQRRQAAFDTKLAEKVRGPTPEEAPSKAPDAVPTPPNRLAAIRAAAEKRQAAEAPVPEGTKAAAEEPAQEVRPEPTAQEPKPLTEQGALGARRFKRAIDTTEKPLPPREEKQYVARNADTGDEVARFKDFEDAKAHKDKFPNDDITHEAAFKDGALAARRTPAVRKAEVTERLKPLIDKAGPDRLQVHEGLHDPAVPQHLRDDAAEHNHPDPRGVYDPTTGAIHVFADASGHATVEDAHDTAVHEMAHQGVRSFLGDDYAATMKSVFDNVHDRVSAMRNPIDGISKTTARDWMRDYASQHNLDARNPRHQALLADEYAAHLAERDAADPNHENPTILRRVIATVRAALRRLGVVHEWTDDDIRRLLRQSHNDTYGESDHARAARAYRGDGLLWADSPDESTKHLPEDSPGAQGHRYAQVVAANGNHGRGYVVSRGDAHKSFMDNFGDRVTGAKDTGRSAYLHGVPFRNLPDHVNESKVPAARELDRERIAMQGRQGQFNIDDDALRAKWTGWAKKAGPERSAAFDDLQHLATIVQADPSKPFEHRYSEAARAANPKKAAADEARLESYKKDLAPMYKSLGEEGQSLYKEVRDRYAEHRDAQDKALDKRAKDMGLDDPKREQLMALLRKTMESGRITPYAPLMRFGDHWASAKDAKGDLASYSQFDSRPERQRWESEMQRQGYTTDGGKDLKDGQATVDRVNPKFMKEVLDIVGGSEDSKVLREAIWQKYMDALPDQSYRKNRMPRSGIAGYSNNARRAFATYTQHSAHAVASLEHEHLLDAKYEELKAQAQTLQREADADPKLQREADWVHSVTEVMGKHLAKMKSPSHAGWADAATNFGFHWMLGANAGTVARIGMQQWISAYPYLRSRYGTLGAARELGKAMKQFSRSGGKWRDALTGDDQRAWDDMRRVGVFQNLSSHSLTMAAKGDPVLTTDDPGGFRKAASVAGKVSQFAFNGVENFNRQSTAIAAYRLARKQGMGHDDAVRAGIDASQSTHYEYSPSNRPLMLKNPFGKVAGLFAQYGINQIYQIGRSFRDAYVSKQGGEPGERRLARRYFNGMMTMGALAFGAGNLATPLFSIYDAIEGTNDDPVDSKAELTEYLKEHLGSKFLADAVMHGPLSAATRASFQSLNPWDLAYRPPGRTAGTLKDRIMGAVYNRLLGPLTSIPSDAIDAYSQYTQGERGRSLEHFLPPGVRGIVKAIRYGTEGVRSPNALPGAEVLPQGSLSPYELALQALNLTPEKLANAYDESNARANMKSAIYKRADDILNHLALAHAHRDDDEIERANDERTQFLASHPRLAPMINAREVAKRIRGAAHAVDGVTMPRGLRNDPDMATLGSKEDE